MEVQTPLSQTAQAGIGNMVDFGIVFDIDGMPLSFPCSGCAVV